VTVCADVDTTFDEVFLEFETVGDGSLMPGPAPHEVGIMTVREVGITASNSGSDSSSGSGSDSGSSTGAAASAALSGRSGPAALNGRPRAAAADKTEAGASPSSAADSPTASPDGGDTGGGTDRRGVDGIDVEITLEFEPALPLDAATGSEAAVPMEYCVFVVRSGLETGLSAHDARIAATFYKGLRMYSEGDPDNTAVPNGAVGGLWGVKIGFGFGMGLLFFRGAFTLCYSS
jgi:hypothetical protein